MLRRSQYLHLIALGGGRLLCLHAVNGTRLVLDAQMAAVLEYFESPRPIEQAVLELSALLGCPPDQIERCAADFLKRGILIQSSQQEETARTESRFSGTYGRDPIQLLEKYRRENAEGGAEYWAVGAARTLGDFAADLPVFHVILLGDCDVQMEADFLRTEARRRGIDLRVAATFREDLRLLQEMPHDAIIVGALPSRHVVATGTPADHGGSPSEPLLVEARDTIQRLRAASQAPILINNVPVPTVQPLGMSDRGVHSHKNRFRLANLALDEMAPQFPGVYIVDVDAAFSAAGKDRLLDDSLVSFTHFGSLGWMLQRPESERAAVHNLFPEIGPLAQQTGGDPYAMETIFARAHMDALMSILAIDQKKCVIVDLDGTLWPGVLAETGSPFAWTREISGAFSFVGLYFGLHEALKSLLRRGIVLACASKNDESTVRELWRYEQHYPQQRLLHWDDFVSHRVNWENKVDNIRSIADELGFKLSSFVFIDDNPVERERVRQFLPEVLVLGENPFELRHWLLTDPRLQPASVTAESAARSEMVRAQLERDKERPAAANDQAFRDSLELSWDVARLRAAEDIPRIKELFDRTTQFNTTGRKFRVAELAAMLDGQDHDIFTMRLRDRFGDHGMVGACVVEQGVIVALAVSCRALGLDVEHRFMETILADLSPRFEEISGLLIPTSRNLPARNIFKDHGFIPAEDGVWRYAPATSSFRTSQP